MLETALDVGIRHFDCARMYGHGLAERTIGLVAKRRREEMIIATKFGIPANQVFEAFPSLQYPAKAVGLILRKIVPTKPQSVGENRFSEAEAERNLSASLKAIQTEYLDVLFLHEPDLGEIDQVIGLNAWAEKKKRAGIIRHFGLAGENSVSLGARLAGSPWSEIIQAPYRLRSTTTQTASPYPPQFVYGLYSHRADQAERTTTLPSGADRSGQLQAALLEYPQLSILISTTKLAHLRSAAQAMHDAASQIETMRASE